MFGLGVGLAGGWAVVTEYPAAPATALVMALAVVHARRALAWVVLGALGSLAVLAVYNLAAFGSTLHVSYETVQGFAGMQQGLLGVTTPKRTVLQEILFGSFRGLLPLAPALALSPLGLGLLWRERGVRPVVLTITAIVVYYLLFNASYAYWHGGFSYGPRHLGACLPFMCLGLGQLWSRGDRLLRAGLSGLTAWGMALAGMAVSTTPMLPESVMSPITDIVWPTFARGELALNHDLYVVRPVAGVVSGGVLERGAWNLGQLAGLNGHASLLPLVLIWLGAALAWRAPGANVDARRSRSYHRLSVIASPRDPD
jgi:hypothetical protein